MLLRVTKIRLMLRLFLLKIFKITSETNIIKIRTYLYYTTFLYFFRKNQYNEKTVTTNELQQLNIRNSNKTTPTHG